MAIFKVEDICVGEPDSAGNNITTVFAKVTARYAIYATSERVMIHFADDDAQGVNQRDAIKPLAAVRAEIEGLISYLRANPSPQNNTLLASSIDSLGRSLAEALKDNVSGATAMLTAMRNDLVEARAAKIRTIHLGFAALSTLGMICLAAILNSSIFTNKQGLSTLVSPTYWMAAGVGAIGALFSIAIQFRDRKMDIDLQNWDNFCHAILRIFVGAVSGTVLIALLKADLIDVTLSGKSVTGALSKAVSDGKDAVFHGLIIAAFAAGFTERLVANFLSDFGKPVTPPPPKASGTEKDITGESANPKAKDSPQATTPKSDNVAENVAEVPTQSEDTPEPDEDVSEVPAPSEDTPEPDEDNPDAQEPKG